jgi:uncharacterized membrane protein
MGEARVKLRNSCPFACIRGILKKMAVLIPGLRAEILFMGGLSLLCFCASLFRCVWTRSAGFIFLNWNLFLACIPWVVTTLLRTKEKLHKSKIAFMLMLLLWLLFFPNAPYILTDLLHLRNIPTMTVWSDLIMILCFAWTGLLFGFLSLLDMEHFFASKIKPALRVFLTVFLLFVGSFGVYIGRYLRWNSWDFITKPFGLLQDIGERLINPFAHQTTWGMTLFMGIFLNAVYWSLRLIVKREKR